LFLTPTRFVSLYTADASDGAVLVQIRRHGAGDAPTVTAADAQLENVTGNADITVPSEYVSTMAADWPDGYPAAVLGVAIYPTRNVCTVASNVAICPGDELHDDLNAASDESGNETDATTGWTSVTLDGTGANVFESQSSAVSVGIYAIHANSNDTPTGGARFYKDIQTDFGLIAGERYVLSADTRHVGSGDIWDCNVSSATNLYGDQLYLENLTNAATSFVPGQVTFVHIAGTTRYFGCRENGTNNGGVYLDNFSVQLAEAPLSPAIMDGLLIEEAGLNSVLQSRDFDTTWVDLETPTTAQDQIGIDAIPNTSWTLGDNDGGAFEAVRQIITSVPNDSNTHIVSIYIEKDDDESRFPELHAKLNNGSGDNQACQLNTMTGSTTMRVDGGAADSCGAIDSGIWWRLWVTATNDTSGNNEIEPFIYPSVTTTWGAAEAAATGTAVFDAAQVELNKSFPSSPIYTTVSAVPRAADVITTPSAGNISDTAGCVVATVRRGDDVVGSNYVLGWQGSPLYFSGTAVVITDGTNFGSQGAILANTAATIGAKWSGSIMNAIADGTVGTNATYDGDFGGGATVNIGTSSGGVSALNGTIKNLMIWPSDPGDSCGRATR